MLEIDEKKAIIDRAKQALGIKADAAFAEFLGIGPTVLAGWKTRNQIDFATLKEKMTAEQFIFAVYDAKVILSTTMAMPDFITRAEFITGLIAVNERVDRLTALLAERLGTSEAPPEATPE